MEFRLRPEPSDDERRAILRALARRPVPSSAYSSRWRKAGLDYATTRPRSRRGATRA